MIDEVLRQVPVPSGDALGDKIYELLVCNGQRHQPPAQLVRGKAHKTDGNSKICNGTLADAIHAIREHLSEPNV
jgi:hypothetical protein